MSEFARKRASDYQNRGGGGGAKSFIENSIFFNMKVSGDTGSKYYDAYETEDGEKEGWSEKVLILGKFEELPVINYHRQNSDDGMGIILCNQTFDDDCPACQYYFELDEVERKDCPHRASDSMHVLPVLSLRHVDKPQIAKGKWQSQPIYWLDIVNTSYKDDYRENWERLKSADEKHPIHKYPYQIFGEKQAFKIDKKTKAKYKDPRKWYYKPQKPVDLSSVVEKVDHPFIQDYWNEDKGRFDWDADYYDMVFALAIARCKRYCYPHNGKPFDYQGNYTKALEMFAEKKEEYPKVSVRIDNEDEDERPRRRRRVADEEDDDD